MGQKIGSPWEQQSETSSRWNGYGVDFTEETFSQCVPCLEGKQTRQPFKKSKAQRADEALQLVHTDLCGPMEQTSWDGARYFMTLIDDKIRKTFVYFLKSKDEAKMMIEEFKVLAENQEAEDRSFRQW